MPVSDRSEPSTTPLVTVTGATGHNGRVIAERLLQGGVRVRALARSADKLRALAAQGAETGAGDLGDTSFLTEACRGADAVFAMVPQRYDVADYYADQRRLVRSLIAALDTAGVSHVVTLSTPIARLRRGLPAVLADFQDALRTMPGLSTIVLQSAYFMENFLSSIPMIRSAGILGGAVGPDVPLPMVATRDVADVAAAYLRSRSFHGYAERPLPGPRDYTFGQACAILGAAIGKPDLRYIQFSPEEFRLGLVSVGFSASAAQAFVDMTTVMNNGAAPRGPRRDAPSATLTSLEAFAREVFAPAYGSHTGSTA